MDLNDQNLTLNIARQLGNREGFFQFYFKELGRYNDGLPVHRTNVEAFNYVNDLHLDYFGEYRYSGYDSFRKQLKTIDKTR